MTVRGLQGTVCVVTGATRGLGKGIALQLGQAGATVYVTGRTLQQSTDGKHVPGSLGETAQEIEARGGKAVAVQCDHSSDEQVAALFERVNREQNGRLDILVNNAYSAVRQLMDNMGKKFWEMETRMWDDVNVVGLRNHYICSVYAARMMVPRKSGLIVNVSSAGGLVYLFNVPYGVGKSACDRMAADCAVELRKHNVAYVSLWPGMVNTEHMQDFIGETESSDRKAGLSASQFKEMSKSGETVEFAGIAIARLAQDENLMKKSGKILIAADLASEYGFSDINGTDPDNLRAVKTLVKRSKYGSWLATFLPSWLKLPGWVIHLGSNKF